MKARKLIANATFEPDQVKAVSKAFEDAWTQIAPDVSKHTDAIEAARLKLANVVVALAKSKGIQDPQTLTHAAIEVMFAKPTEVRS